MRGEAIDKDERGNGDRVMRAERVGDRRRSEGEGGTERERCEGMMNGRGRERNGESEGRNGK